MAKIPNFRTLPAGATKTQIEAPAHVMANAPPLNPAGPPLPMGALVMTDHTREQLQKLGWQEGDPLPGDLGSRLAEIQREIAKDRETAKPDVPAGWQPPKSKIVDISTLPPERQAELRQHLAEYKKFVTEEAAIAQAQEAQESRINPDAPPDVQEAQRIAMAAEQQPRATFVNDLPTQRPLPVPEGKQLGGVSGMHPAIAAAPPSPPPAAPPEHAPEAHIGQSVDAGALLAPTHCPRCLWDLRMGFNITASEHDKVAYIAGVLSGKRFEKEMLLLNGSLRVRFRGLTGAETRILRQQLRYDTQAGRIQGEGDFFIEMVEYRLVLSLSQITHGSEIFDIPAIADIPYDPPKPGDPPETALVPMRDWFYKEVAPTETLLRVLREHFQQFQRLLELLETMSLAPDFWPGIDSPR